MWKQSSRGMKDAVFFFLCLFIFGCFLLYLFLSVLLDKLVKYN